MLEGASKAEAAVAIQPWLVEMKRATPNAVTSCTNATEYTAGTISSHVDLRAFTNTMSDRDLIKHEKL